MSFIIEQHRQEVAQKQIQFSDNTNNIKLSFPNEFKKFSISLNFNDVSSAILWDLALIVSAIRENFEDANIILDLDYLPNARADRVFEKGNAFPLKVFCQMVDNLGINYIFIEDPHSNAYEKYFKKTIVIQHSQEELASAVCDSLFKSLKGIVLVAPDAGAVEKIKRLKEFLFKHYQLGSDILYCSKVRDVSTGKIKEFVIPESPNKEAHHLVVDDISDAGGTFIPIGLNLKAQGVANVDLYVTHGLFTKGLDMFDKAYDKIYLTNIINTYINRDVLDDFNARKE